MVRTTRPRDTISTLIADKDVSNLSNVVKNPFPLLLTKIQIPPLPTNLVPRPRLTEYIDQQMRCKLTLIVAPVGFGKTTLLSAWCEKCTASKIPCTWLSLDERDNDPKHFLAYLLFALKNIQFTSNFGQLLPPLYPEPLSEENLTLLINEITIAFPAEFMLVLDNYHVINAQKIHDALNFLLNHLPPNMHLLVASRTLPPFPLASLRVQRQLIELDSNELRFQAHETTTFLRTTMQLELQDVHITELEHRIDGWAAGLQLAAYALQKLNDPDQVINSFSGNHRYILDYLTTEFFHQQSPIMRTILLQTSILERINASLCAAVTKVSDGQSILEMLEKTHLFLVPLDEEHTWYRYSHLFKDFLYHQLARTNPESVVELHNRACIWFAQHGDYAEAIEHALSAKNFSVAIDLISQIAQSLLNQCKAVQLLKWLIAIPDELILARPALCFSYAWALLFNGITGNVESYLQRVILVSEEMEEWHWQALLAATQGYLANVEGDMPKAIEASQYALKYLPSIDTPMRTIAAMSAGSSLWLGGDEVACTPFFEQAYAESIAKGYLPLAIISAWMLGKTYALQGQLCKALEVFQQALLQTEQARSSTVDEPLPAEGLLLMGIGYIFRQWNDLEQAADYLVQGIELCKQWEAPGLAAIGLIDGAITLARIKAGQGQHETVHEIFLQAEQYSCKYGLPFNIHIMLKIFKKRLLLNEDPELTQIIQTRVSRKSYLYEIYQLVEARTALRNGAFKQAIELLDSLLTIVKATQRINNMVEILMLQALAYSGLHQIQLAIGTMSQAITRGVGERYMSIFIEEGYPLVTLLEQTVEAQRKRPSSEMYEFPHNYALSILTACEGRSLTSSKETSATPIKPPDTIAQPEPLSEREMEVLRLLMQGMLNKEIAEYMCLSESTIRWHVKNIYGKLHVHNRAQLMLRAQTLKLS